MGFLTRGIKKRFESQQSMIILALMSCLKGRSKRFLAMRVLRYSIE